MRGCRRHFVSGKLVSGGISFRRKFGSGGVRGRRALVDGRIRHSVRSEVTRAFGGVGSRLKRFICSVPAVSETARMRGLRRVFGRDHLVNLGPSRQRALMSGAMGRVVAAKAVGSFGSFGTAVLSHVSMRAHLSNAARAVKSLMSAVRLSALGITCHGTRVRGSGVSFVGGCKGSGSVGHICASMVGVKRSNGHSSHSGTRVLAKVLPRVRDLRGRRGTTRTHVTGIKTGNIAATTGSRTDSTSTERGVETFVRSSGPMGSNCNDSVKGPLINKGTISSNAVLDTFRRCRGRVVGDSISRSAGTRGLVGLCACSNMDGMGRRLMGDILRAVGDTATSDMRTGNIPGSVVCLMGTHGVGRKRFTNTFNDGMSTTVKTVMGFSRTSNRRSTSGTLIQKCTGCYHVGSADRRSGRGCVTRVEDVTTNN